MDERIAHLRKDMVEGRRRREAAEFSERRRELIEGATQRSGRRGSAQQPISTPTRNRKHGGDETDGERPSRVLHEPAPKSTASTARGQVRLMAAQIRQMQS